MEPLTEPEIRASFVNCSKGEAKGLTLPARTEEIRWSDLDFLAWRDPRAPQRAYLVARHDGEVIGMSLRATDPPKSRLRSGMCGLCTTTHGLIDVALFSARRAGKSGKDGNTLGLYICANLRCSDYLRGKLKPDTPQPNETVTLDERIERLEGKLHRFVAQVLETR
ncbi:FBP domain-containing protein [Amycolatopsis sp. 195334CR]|uniref:FBP domain-containing protein n=1 Tax=Amycolatopsis sp. 195334CR TaxID=2814588 RepID=UPI001A8D7C3B|nr:FBP domain-containing protein [Amycolatopsis sp. 195334CR]MBN6035300.1 FBP domain-containing protein [Amycolatopsis sp. 195334CR]